MEQKKFFGDRFITGSEVSSDALVKERKPIVTEIRWFENRDQSILIALVGFFGLSRF